MGGLSVFLAENAIKEEVVKYVASKRFVEEATDANTQKAVQKPVYWKLACITSEEDEAIRKSCTKRVQVPGKKNMYLPETDFEAYAGQLAVRCITYPNLDDAGLQNSYGAMGAEQLLKVMLKPGEYQDLLKKVQEINGFDTGMEDLVEEAKN